jgi:hypothetical protein
MKLKVTVTPTSDGTMEYIQVISDDTLSVNIVLVAEQIKVLDTRKKNQKNGKA